MTGLITIVRNDEDPPRVDRIPRADVRKVSVSHLRSSKTLSVIAFGIMQPYELPWSMLADDAQRATLYDDVVSNLEIDVTWTLTLERLTTWSAQEQRTLSEDGWEFDRDWKAATRWRWVRTEQRPS